MDNSYRYRGEGRTSCPICRITANEAILESPNYLVCLKCGVIYHKIVAQIPIEESWDCNYYSDDRVIKYYQKRQSGYHKIVMLMNKYCSRKGNWLDIGCGFGNLLQEAYNTGWQVYGIDPSKICVEVVKKGAKYVHIVHGLVEDKLQDFSDIDVASITDTLRIIMQPWKVLNGIYDMLNDGGWILIREGNADKRKKIRQRENAVSTISNVTTLQDFSPQTMENALRLYGFRNVHSFPSPIFLETENDEYHESLLIKQVIKGLLKHGMETMSRLIHMVTRRKVFLGPNFITLAQK